MTLTLDHIQRLNLYALLGVQRGDVGTVRALWAIQDKIALTPDEEKAIELRRELVASQERVAWNSELTISVKEIELGEPEVARVKAALQTWDSYGAASDRRWLQPLIEAMFSTGPQGDNV